MQATTNAFDILVDTFSRDMQSQVEVIAEKPHGQAGQRQWAFSLNWVDSMVFAEPADFMDYITEITGLGAQELYSFVDSHSNSSGSNHSYLVGEVNSDPAQCWALQVHAYIPYDSNLNSKAEFKALEDPKSIQVALKKLNDSQLARATREINFAVNSFAGGDNAKMLQLFEALREGPYGQWVDALAAYLSARGLETGTPATSASKPAPRV